MMFGNVRPPFWNLPQMISVNVHYQGAAAQRPANPREWEGHQNIDIHRAEAIEKWREQVRTRKGSSRWVKSKMFHRIAPIWGAFATTIFDWNAAAYTAVNGFAERWNGRRNRVFDPGRRTHCMVAGARCSLRVPLRLWGRRCKGFGLWGAIML